MDNLNSLPFKTMFGVVFINYDEIILLKAERKYTLIFTVGDKKPIQARCSISSLKEKLPHDFFQCHRSFIINLKHIALFEHKCKMIKMSNEEEVRLSEKYQKDFMKLID
jgi:two-component system, LytTR family, response regulator